MAFQDKKFLDAEGITHLVGLLDEYPNNQVLGSVIDAIEGELEQKAEKSEIPVESGTGVGSVKTKDFTVNKQTFSNTASGIGAFAEGLVTTASGITSHAEGQNTTASGISSHAEGMGTNALVNSAHAEGSETIASGPFSHAEGFRTQASGRFSHAEGNNTVAQGQGEHVSGGFNTISATIYSTWEAGKEYNVGDIVVYSQLLYRCKVANTENTFKQSYWAEYPLGSTLYSYIIGNGIADDARSNAYALDWSGNGHYMGDVYVGANTDSSGGERLAKESELGLRVVRLI